jgi:hypothetical protein
MEVTEPCVGAPSAADNRFSEVLKTPEIKNEICNRRKNRAQRVVILFQNRTDASHSKNPSQATRGTEVTKER